MKTILQIPFMIIGGFLALVEAIYYDEENSNCGCDGDSLDRA